MALGLHAALVLPMWGTAPAGCLAPYSIYTFDAKLTCRIPAHCRIYQSQQQRGARSSFSHPVTRFPAIDVPIIYKFYHTDTV